MRYREYAAECLRRASSGKLKTAELWTAILGIVFTAIAYFWSPLGVFMSWLPAAVFVLIFVLLLLFGLVTAPVRMHQNQEEACRRLEEQLDERKRRQRIVDKLAKLHQQCLQLLMRKVDCNDAYISWKQEIEDWYERAQTEIEGSLS
jgi:MFS superfamily sulfate permease-like transporter